MRFARSCPESRNPRVRIKHPDLEARLDRVLPDLIVASWLEGSVERSRENWTFCGVVGRTRIAHLTIDAGTGHVPVSYQIPGGRVWAMSPSLMGNPLDLRQWLVQWVWDLTEDSLPSYPLPYPDLTWITVLGWRHQVVPGIVTPECVSFRGGFTLRGSE